MYAYTFVIDFIYSHSVFSLKDLRYFVITEHHTFKRKHIAL